MNVATLTDIAAYLPQDRRQAIVGGFGLPERTTGAALFADISGFTPLTEAFMRVLGVRRGVEELTIQLNRVYDLLIAEIDRSGGSVISFSGDAITCWFDGDDGLRATACAIELHSAMARLGSIVLPTGGKIALALKAAVACGPVRRFLVGDPAIQLLDIVAGAPIMRVAEAEHVAQRAEVALSLECFPAVADHALLLEWRAGTSDDADRLPIIGGLLTTLEARPWPAIAPDALPPEQLRAWLLPAIYMSIQSGTGELLPELRQAVALFLRFDGIDYDADDCPAKLDMYIRWVQHVLTRYDGALLQLTIGDKGSYFYAAFGAPTMHEDSAQRAVAAALELRVPPESLGFIRSVQIGISQGTMRVGAYGSVTRRTYGVLGDAVNLAARLMQVAEPGSVLVSDAIIRAIGHAFTWEPVPPLLIKGKRDPVAAARLLAARDVGVGGERYSGALIGRRAELDLLAQRLAPLFSGRSAGLIPIYGEPGVGKSRLVYELRHQTQQQLHWLIWSAPGPLQQSLAPVRNCLRWFFDQDATRSAAENREQFATTLGTLMSAIRPIAAPSLLHDLEQASSFLGVLLDLAWPNSLYEATAPEQRFGRIVAACIALMQAASLRQPVVIEVEDAHRLDNDTWSLLSALLRASAAFPLAVVLTSRYEDDGSRPLCPLDPADLSPPIDLQSLALSEVRALAAQTVGSPLDAQIERLLMEKTGGNPLFVEQLALDLRERGLLMPHSARLPDEGTNAVFAAFSTALDSDHVAEIPSSITAVLIARLDRLPSAIKTLVKTAAVLGQDVDLRLLRHILADDHALAEKVEQADAAGLWMVVGDDRRRFRHMLMREAAYALQGHTQQRLLHAQAIAAIEQVLYDELAGSVADLVYHARQAGDVARERRYLGLLGEQAFSISAGYEALVCFERALALMPDTDEAAAVPQRVRLLAQCARTHLLLGDLDKAHQTYQASRILAEAHGEHAGAAEACLALGVMAYQAQNYVDASTALEDGLTFYRAAGNRAGEARVLNQLGAVYIELGEADKALECYELVLRLERRVKLRERGA